MSNQEIIDFLNLFKEGDIWKELQRVKMERLTQVQKELASPLMGIPDVLHHARLGGIVEGLQFNELEILLEDLEIGNKPIQEKRGR